MIAEDEAQVDLVHFRLTENRSKNVATTMDRNAMNEAVMNICRKDPVTA